MANRQRRAKLSSHTAPGKGGDAVMPKGKPMKQKIAGKELARIGSSMSKKVDAGEWGGYFEPDEKTVRKIKEIDTAYAKSSRSTKPFARRG